MAMKAVTVSSAGATPIISNDVPTPTPGEGQVLVKTLYTAINPVDTMMAGMGSPFIKSYPFTPGCDAAGTIVSTGPNPRSALGTIFKPGDLVFGCSRLGTPGHTTWAEYFLFDAELCIPVPETLSIPEAAGTGVGLFTAALGVYGCLDAPLSAARQERKGEWAIVFGGGGNVGQFAVQLLSIAGYDVVVTASKAAEEVLKNIGAKVVVDYKIPQDQIVQEVQAVSSGKLTHAFDASACNSSLLGTIYGSLNPLGSTKRRYTTVNPWEPLPEGDFVVKPIELGPIGSPDAVELNTTLSKIIPVIYELLKQGQLKPSKYTIKGEGVEGILDAWEVQKAGSTGGAKVVVKVADK